MASWASTVTILLVLSVQPAYKLCFSTMCFLKKKKGNPKINAEKVANIVL